LKTVSTKLSKQDFDKFFEHCNEEGLCQSELLRNIVQDYCQDYNNEEVTNLEDEEVINLEDEKPQRKILKKLDITNKSKDEQPKSKTLREFDVKEGRMIENGYDVGSTSEYFLIAGNVWKKGELIGRITPEKSIHKFN